MVVPGQGLDRPAQSAGASSAPARRRGGTGAERAQMPVTYGRSQRVGSIFLRLSRQLQEGGDHLLYLDLARVPVARHRLLDLNRIVLRDRHIAFRGGQQRHASHLTELERALDVAREKDLLQADVGGLVFPDDAGQLREDALKTPVLRQGGSGSHRAVGDMPEPASVDADDAPAGFDRSGVYAQDRFDRTFSDPAGINRPFRASRPVCRSSPRRSGRRRGPRGPR